MPFPNFKDAREARQNAGPKPAMYHMLKSLGIDPEKITEFVESVIPQFFTKIHERIETIEKMQQEILVNQIIILKKLERNAEQDDRLNVNVLLPAEAGITVKANGGVYGG